MGPWNGTMKGQVREGGLEAALGRFVGKIRDGWVCCCDRMEAGEEVLAYPVHT